MEFIETIAFMLIKNNSILVEKRKMSKKLDPGKIVIPGGHIEKGESSEQAMLRELKEELNLTPNSCQYLCSLLYKGTEGLLRIHYYTINSWQGSIENNEAEELMWIPTNNPTNLSLDVDKVAIHEFLRLN